VCGANRFFPDEKAFYEKSNYLCVSNKQKNNEKKEFGKWLMDIAKYITTAVILASVFGEVEQRWIFTWQV